MGDARRFISPIDMNGNEIRLAAFHVLASAPSNPPVGLYYYDSTMSRLRFWTGSAWIDASARANHTGTQLASTISDFDTAVRLNRLDQLAVPTAPVDVNNQRIANVAAPVQATDAVNKAYADNAALGLQTKPAARLATTAALPAHTRVGNTLTATGSGALTIDGVAVAVDDRILVKDEGGGTHLENGLYRIIATGSPGTPWEMTRTADADTDAEVTASMFVFVSEGTVNAESGWTLATNNPISLNTTALTFVQFSGGGTLTAGAGMTKTGSQFDVGQGLGIIVNADTIQIDTGLVPRKYSQNVGDGVATAIAVGHMLGSRDVVLAIRENASPYSAVDVAYESTDVNSLTIRPAVAPSVNEFRVTVHV